MVILQGCADRGRSPADEAAAAARAAEAAAEAQARAERDAALEAQRLEALWNYHDTTVAQGRQRTAAIRSTNNVETDGQDARAVQLVFRDHASWGRSSYLVLQAGDFDCAPRCTVTVTADDAAPVRMAARRPDTDEAIAMFINDAPALWRLTDGASRLVVAFPVVAGGVRSAAFDVAGLDASKMPGWESSGAP